MFQSYSVNLVMLRKRKKEKNNIYTFEKLSCILMSTANNKKKIASDVIKSTYCKNRCGMIMYDMQIK